MLCHWQIVTILSVAAPQPAYLPGAAASWGEHRSFLGGYSYYYVVADFIHMYMHIVFCVRPLCLWPVRF